MASEPLTTGKSWEDLALDAQVRRQVDEVMEWSEHGMVLFVGEGSVPADVAALIAREKGCPAYRVDVAKLVTMAFDETKANLDPIFERAARENALLLIEHVEAVFAQRGSGGGR